MTLAPFEFSVLALAVYRAARIVSTDSISAGLRQRIDGWVDDAEGVYGEKNGGRDGWRAWLADLVACPFCTSVYLAWIGYVILVAALGRGAGFWEHAVMAWGVAGGAAILTALDGKLTE